MYVCVIVCILYTCVYEYMYAITCGPVYILYMHAYMYVCKYD